MTKANYIAYYRVSTNKQGLGLEAQERAVANYVTGHHGDVIEEYTEVETGKGSNALKKRPKLAEALKACRKQKAVLIIAKLDRLARNVHFISGLMESKVEFVCCDNPHANRLMIHMLAAFAEHERELISTRTKEGLAATKARGTILGKHGKEVLSKENRSKAKDFAQSLIPVIYEIKGLGMTTQQSIANELTRRKIPTARGNTTWYQPNVYTLLKRIESVG
jgi:DNA invertase Pin-like site-specific DNA recombinase